MVRPFSSGRMVMTPFLTAISWTSIFPANSPDTAIRRSGALPLFSMVRKPPPVLAPPGVARLQAWLMTRSPALTSSARAGVASRQLTMAASMARPVSEMRLLMFIAYSSSRRNLGVYQGMLEAERAHDGEHGKAQRKLDAAVSRQLP